MEELNRVLIVKFQNGEVKRVVFPEKWTVTFSGFIPKMNPKGYAISTPSLRIYGPRKIQMACLTDVMSFRDERIQIEQLNKTDLEDLYWMPQEELDNAPVIVKGKIMKGEFVSIPSPYPTEEEVEEVY